MKRFHIAMTLTLSIIAGNINATVESWDPATETGTIGPGGCVEAGNAYMQSVFLSTHANAFACRELTDEEIEEAENMPGGAYNDGKWVGEHPQIGEDEHGGPVFASHVPEWDDLKEPQQPDIFSAQHVFEGDDDNIFILEDDGEITEINVS